MWSVYAHGDNDDNTVFNGVCKKCRHKEIENPKGWINTETNKRRIL